MRLLRNTRDYFSGFCLYLLLLAIISAGCTTTKISGAAEGGELIFHSGFEEDCTVVKKGSDADIVGADRSLDSHNDWVNDLDNNPLIGNFNLQFHKGDSTMRFARIIPEPGNPANKVLQFWLNQPSEEQNNGRMQANLYNNMGLKEFYQSVRLYLSPDFNAVRTYPKDIHWLTLAEYWNNITWSQKVPYGFRITVGLGKATGGEEDLHFIIDAQDCELFQDGKQKYTTIWAQTNKMVKVPVARWFTLEYYFKEGDRNNGRYYMAITAEGKSRQVVFDVRNITQNTHDPNPDGVTDFNPMKLYTSKDLVNYIRSKDRTLQIYWDDFKLWKDRRPSK